VSVKNRSAF